ncbi:MAG TPA: hypothetical protein VEK34_16525 [Methylocella sp.]|nr:hypothetical protein [Methylocella sp.]
MKTFSAEQRDILARMGLALLFIQTTEFVIEFCMKYVLPAGGVVTLEMLESQRSGERKRTLGQFLRELRKRVDLDDRFDAILDEFLQKRNELIHRIDDIPGWSLDHEEGLRAARGFMDRVMQLNHVVLEVFSGLVRAWQSQEQITTEFDSLLGDIDQIYSSLASRIFFKKST